jgi:hypothetical protein
MVEDHTEASGSPHMVWKQGVEGAFQMQTITMGNFADMLLLLLLISE